MISLSLERTDDLHALAGKEKIPLGAARFAAGAEPEQWPQVTHAFRAARTRALIPAGRRRSFRTSRRSQCAEFCALGEPSPCPCSQYHLFQPEIELPRRHPFLQKCISPDLPPQSASGDDCAVSLWRWRRSGHGPHIVPPAVYA